MTSMLIRIRARCTLRILSRGYHPKSIMDVLLIMSIFFRMIIEPLPDSEIQISNSGFRVYGLGFRV